jgi:hypothetical protein
VNVVLAVLGDIKVDYKVNGGNIKAPTCHISCYEDLSLSSFELVQSIQSLGLRELPIDVDRFEVKVTQDKGQFHALITSSRENNCFKATGKLR